MGDVFYGVDGLVGFSQGGGLCLLLVEALDKLSPSSRERLRYMATFAADDVFFQRGSGPAAVPSAMHFGMWAGGTDFVDTEAAANELTAAGAKSLTVKNVPVLVGSSFGVCLLVS